MAKLTGFRAGATISNESTPVQDQVTRLGPSKVSLGSPKVVPVWNLTTFLPNSRNGSIAPDSSTARIPSTYCAGTVRSKIRSTESAFWQVQSPPYE